jgi:hypothetical protein
MNDRPHTRSTSVVGFVNGVRSLLGLHDLPCIWLAGTEQDDETNCVVANALGLPVGASDHDDWSTGSKWVMRLRSNNGARLVGLASGLDWRVNPAEVALPEELELCTGVSRWYTSGGRLDLRDLCAIHADLAFGVLRVRRGSRTLRRSDIELPSPATRFDAEHNRAEPALPAGSR